MLLAHAPQQRAQGMGCSCSDLWQRVYQGVLQLRHEQWHIRGHVLQVKALHEQLSCKQTTQAYQSRALLPLPRICAETISSSVYADQL